MNHKYKIYTERNSLEYLEKFINLRKFSSIFILVDENTKKYCLDILKNYLSENIKYKIIEINSGEENKNLETCNLVWQKLTEYNADRRSLLINLGGGIIGDLGGFCASTFKRGISFINIPSTLMAQVDASIGGKLGINFDNLKNQIGLFSTPKAVFINTEFLKTLPKREFLSGFAEIIKHGLIYDEKYLNKVLNLDFDNYESLNEIINESIKIKSEIVLQDPHEKNIRKILNFGHTIGHAIETYSLTKDIKLFHGEAVAIGIICELYLSHKLLNLAIEDVENISKFINSKYQKFNIPIDSINEIIEIMKNDKKNEVNKINFSLIDKIGTSIINQNCSNKDIIEALEYYINLS